MTLVKVDWFRSKRIKGECTSTHYHTRGLCLWIALGRFMFVNETAWRHNTEQSYQRSNNNVSHSVTMSRPFKWHVSLRFSNAMEEIANCKKISNFVVSNPLGKCQLNSVWTQYVCDKSENAWVCTKHWNALDWCYWIALPASPVRQSRNTVSCVSLSFRTHPCVLAIQSNGMWGSVHV